MDQQDSEDGDQKPSVDEDHQSNSATATAQENKDDSTDGHGDGEDMYVYKDFSLIKNEERTYLDSIQSSLLGEPASKKLPAKLNKMLVDPGEFFKHEELLHLALS